jgi:hypothetical protein
MADPRKPDFVICVKNSAKTAYKIECFSAALWPKSAQEKPGTFRVRLNRRWLDDNGDMAFVSYAQLAMTVAVLVHGGPLPQDAPAPELPRGTRVSVPNGRVIDGKVMYDGSRTYTDPLRGYDGRWYVNVVTPTLGNAMVAVDTLKIHEGR